MSHRWPSLQEQNQVLKFHLLVAGFQEFREERVAVLFILNVSYVHLEVETHTWHWWQRLLHWFTEEFKFDDFD